MTLPKYRSSYVLKPGKYTFRITDPPEKRKFGRATGIILKFSAVSEFGDMEDSTCMLWPWEDEYRILKDEVIKSDEETDWVGKSFFGEIEVGPHPTKENQKQHKIVKIKPFSKTEDKLGAEEHEVVEDTTVTPPLEEEGDPGPGEDEGPSKEEEEDEVPF